MARTIRRRPRHRRKTITLNDNSYTCRHTAAGFHSGAPRNFQARSQPTFGFPALDPQRLQRGAHMLRVAAARADVAPAQPRRTRCQRGNLARLYPEQQPEQGIRGVAAGAGHTTSRAPGKCFLRRWMVLPDRLRETSRTFC